MLPLTRRNQTNWLPDIFNDMFDNDWITRTNVTTAPAVNVIEREKEYDVEVAAPGMTRNDFKVSIDADNNLEIDLEHKVEKNDTDKKEDEQKSYYLRREFSYSQYHQTLSLPDDVDREKIAAHMDNGVLNVILPKLTPAELKKENKIIDIQ